MIGSRRLPSVMTIVTAVLLMSACGSRVSGEAILAGASGGTVRLDEASIAELSQATAGDDAPTISGGGQPAAADSSASASIATSTGVVTPKPGAAGPADVAKPANGRATVQKSAANTAPAATSARESCTSPGAPLKIGQIGAFSGLSAQITTDARTALAAWVQAVNARGGIACHPVQLYVVDSGGDPAKASALFQQLVEEKGAQAIVGSFDGLGFKGVRSSAERLRVPVIGGDGLDPAWNESPYLFPVGAGISGIVRGAMRQARDAGATNFGLLYCVEASVCTTVAKRVPPESERVGGKLTYSVPISATQTDFTAQCQGAKNARVEALVVAMDGASIGRVARSCASINYHPPFVTSGLVLSAATAADPGIRTNTVSSSSAVAPWMDQFQDTAGQREYHAVLRKYAPRSQPTGSSITAWAGGKLLEAAIANVGAAAVDTPITTADIMVGLGKINKETLGGLTPPMTFRPDQKFAPLMYCVYFTLLTDTGWTAARGSKPVCS